MIAANGVTARFLESQGLPVDAARAPHAGALGADRRHRGRARRAAAARAERAALQAFLVKRTARGPGALPRPVALGGQDPRQRRVRARDAGPERRRATSGSRSATTRTRPRRTAVSRPRHAAAAEGRARRARRRPTAGASSRRSRATAPSRRTRRRRSSGRCASRRRRSCSRTGSASASTRSSPARRAKGTWVRIRKPAVEGKVVRGRDGLDVGDRVRVELVSTDVERGFIDFARA